VAGGFGYPRWAAGVEPPFQVVAFDHDRPGYVPIGLPLVFRPDIYQECTLPLSLQYLPGRQPSQVLACLL